MLKLLQEIKEVVLLYRMNKYMTRAYNDGHYAGYHGESEESNPFDPDEERFWEWIEGYVDGELDWQEDNK